MNDLISRKALLAEYDRGHIGEPGKARKLIVDAPAVREWIPVSERLPEDYENVLVYSGGVEPGWCARGVFYEYDKYESDTIYGVTHWMPLPEPPKEG